VFLSGNAMVHQFVRVGTLAMMQGGSGATKDVPPFTVVMEMNLLCGLNVVGMRRAGHGSEERMEVKRLYRALFRSGRNLRPALAEAQKSATSAAGRAFLDFIAASKRGVCADVSGGDARDEEQGAA
jgi:UDP-N-acetylglucosamine acyltransferase